MATNDRLRAIIEPIVTGLGLELFDLQFSGSTLSVVVDRPRTAGGTGDEPSARSGIDLSEITAVTRAVSRALDDQDPIAGRYSLEVSSPGLERPLRTPAHFAGAVGELVTIKTVPGYDGPRRLRGTLVRAGAGEHTVVGGDRVDDALAMAASLDLSLEDPPGERRTIVYRDIDKARTVFEWGPESKPGKGGKPAKRGKKAGTPGPGRGEGASREAPGGAASPQKKKNRVDNKKVTAT
jgi:ribosome maturation factor RimP